MSDSTKRPRRSSSPSSLSLVKSPSDPKSYRLVTDLSNSMQVLLVQDVSSKKTACALSVGVGSLSDPVDLPGCAHFLEHMLFMGSEKFPSENELDSFLSSRNGYVNAMTELEYTQYYFELMTETHVDIENALGIFSHFFKAPLLREDCVERETEAVESEYRQALVSDSVRMEHLLLCHLAEERHPYKQFSYGNKKSLLENPKKLGFNPVHRLREFFDAHYSSEKMRLVIVSHVELDLMEEWVKLHFEDVPRRGQRDIAGISEFNTCSERIWGEDENLLVTVKSVKHHHKLSLMWQLPATKKHYKSKSHQFIGHLIGHESQGSLIAVLKDKGWATDLRAGVGEDGYSSSSLCSFMEIEVTCTKKGFQAWQEIVSMCMGYIKMLANIEKFPGYIYEELQLMGKIEFEFQEGKDGTDLVEELASKFQPCFGIDLEDLLRSEYSWQKFEEEEVKEYVKILAESKPLVTLSSKQFGEEIEGESSEEGSDYSDEESDDEDEEEDSFSGDCSDEDMSESDGEDSEISDDEEIVELDLPEPIEENLTEPWFSIQFSKYRMEFPKDQKISATASLFNLPEPNPYLPRKFNLICKKVPSLVAPKNATKMCWHLNELRSLPCPRGDIRICLCPESQTIEDQIKLKFFIGIIAEKLNSDIYLAKMANLDFHGDSDAHGLIIRVSGFSDSLLVLLRQVLAMVKQSIDDLDKFNLVKEHLSKYFKNEETRCKHAVQNIRKAYLLPGRFARAAEKQQIVESLEFEDFKKAIETVSFKGIAGLVVGNFQDSKEVESIIEQTLAVTNGYGAIEAMRCVEISEATVITEDHGNEHEENSVCSLYFQQRVFGKGEFSSDFLSLKIAGFIDLLSTMMREPLFDQLRTQKQLGYEVACDVRETGNLYGFEIWVQSAVASPSEVLGHIQMFLRDFYNTKLGEMSEEQFHQQAVSLAEEKREPPHSLGEETGELWKEVLNGRNRWSFELEVADFLEKSINLEEFKEFVEEFLFVSKRKLCIAVCGKGSKYTEAEEKPKLFELLSNNNS
jgi:nardilysin